MRLSKQEIWARTGRSAKRAGTRKKVDRLRRALFDGKLSAKCEYCRKRITRETATFDHVTPQSAGGYHKQKNGALACRRCNSLKGSMAKGTFLQAIRDGKIKL